MNELDDKDLAEVSAGAEKLILILPLVIPLFFASRKRQFKEKSP